MRLGKILFGLGIIASLSIPAFSLKAETTSVEEKVSIIDTTALKEILDSQGRQMISKVLNQLGLPPLLKIPISNALNALYTEALCYLKTPQYSINLELPYSIDIPLSCSNIRISFAPFYREILQNANDLTGGVIEEGKRCLNGDITACKQIAKRNRVSYQSVENGIFTNDVAYVKGLASPNYANETKAQIERNYQNTIKALSQPSIQSTPKNVVVNNVSPVARMNAENEAGKSTGELIKWGNVKNIPQPLIPYYNFVANKQFLRDTVIQALQERIQQERTELARLWSTMRAYCDTEWNVKTIPPVRGSIGNILGERKGVQQFAQVVKEITGEFKEENICRVKTSSSEILARASKNLPVVRGCCCCDAIPAIHSAKSEVISQIHIATRQVETAIDRVGNMLANVISEEAYRTREQINADSQAIEASIRKALCLKAQLAYQRNKLQLLNLEVQVAQLRVLYSILNSKEMGEFKKKLIEKRQVY